jgi:hypothetical protein
MARQNGQFTWITPTPGTAASSKLSGDSTATAGVVRGFVATERVTVVEVGAIAVDSTAVPGSAFTFRVKKRTGALIANDVIVPVFKSGFAAEGGPGGDPSNSGFDNANAISGGVITNTVPSFVAGSALRAYCEQGLDKGDALVFEVVGNTAGQVAFYAKCYADGAGLIEANDVDSN